MPETLGFIIGLVVGFIAGMRLGPRIKNQEQHIPRAYTDDEMKSLRQRAQLKAEKRARQSEALGEFLAPAPQKDSGLFNSQFSQPPQGAQQHHNQSHDNQRQRRII